MGLKDEIVFLCPARLIPEKGILEFLSAVVDLPQNQFTILLAGDGPLRREIAALVTEKGMPHVCLLGHQDTRRLIQLYALSDVLLLPSPCEPYGFVAVEALWAGLPLLLSDKVGALPEGAGTGSERFWKFHPLDRHSIVRAVESVLATGRGRSRQDGSEILPDRRSTIRPPSRCPRLCKRTARRFSPEETMSTTARLMFFGPMMLPDECQRSPGCPFSANRFQFELLSRLHGPYAEEITANSGPILIFSFPCVHPLGGAAENERPMPGSASFLHCL